MKTFIIYTSSNNEQEIAGGIYIVNAQSSNDASGLWLENAGLDESIISVEEINTRTECFKILQTAIIE